MHLSMDNILYFLKPFFEWDRHAKKYFSAKYVTRYAVIDRPPSPPPSDWVRPLKKPTTQCVL